MTENPIDLTAWVKPGDTVAWSQGSAEPRTLTEALAAQRRALGGIKVFLGASFSSTLSPEHADGLAFSGIGGVGTNSRLARAGVLDVVPSHLSALPDLLRQGRIAVDVALVQTGPPTPDGSYPLGLVADYVPDLVAAARTVVLEVNDQVPRTPGESIQPDHVDHVVETSRPPVVVDPAEADPVDEQIAHHVATLIPDTATIQLGIGAVPAAVARALTTKKRLGVHSGAVGDWLVDLVSAGVVTNDSKRIDCGISVAGAFYGTRRLYEWIHENPAVSLKPVTYTHHPAVLAKLRGLIAINSAVEVDLTGQVNAEVVAGRHVGTVGGQVDFVRAAMASPGGRSVIAFRSTAKGGTISRIVASLTDGVVTTPRSDADTFVTEHGIADIRGLSLSERAKRLAALAAPDFREELLATIPRLL